MLWIVSRSQTRRVWLDPKGLATREGSGYARLVVDGSTNILIHFHVILTNVLWLFLLCCDFFVLQSVKLQELEWGQNQLPCSVCFPSTLKVCVLSRVKCDITHKYICIKILCFLHKGTGLVMLQLFERHWWNILNSNEEISYGNPWTQFSKVLQPKRTIFYPMLCMILLHFTSKWFI